MQTVSWRKKNRESNTQKTALFMIVIIVIIDSHNNLNSNIFYYAPLVTKDKTSVIIFC